MLSKVSSIEKTVSLIMLSSVVELVPIVNSRPNKNGDNVNQINKKPKLKAFSKASSVFLLPSASAEN